jgi:hypothetical protein
MFTTYVPSNHHPCSLAQEEKIQLRGYTSQIQSQFASDTFKLERRKELQTCSQKSTAQKRTDLESNKNSMTLGMKRKLGLIKTSSKSTTTTTTTTTGVRFVAYSTRLVRPGYSVRSVSCGHLLLA